MSTEATRVIGNVEAGGHTAEHPFEAVYAELRRLAALHIAALHPGQTLQATALVHEAYLKLVGTESREWQGRGHFLNAASRAMRMIVIDRVRRKLALKRGGDVERDALDETIPVGAGDLHVEDILALDEVLTRLESAEPRRAQVVVMRYFGGLSEEEIAEALDVAVRTVERDWRFARAWLHAALTERAR